MASIIIAGGVALTDLIREKRRKKAAKRADQELMEEHARAENQNYLDQLRTSSQEHLDEEVPPAYEDVVSDSRKANVTRSQRIPEGARASHT